MNDRTGTCPLTQRQLIEGFFLEHRAQVIDLAAFLDRLDRAAARDAEDDFRLRALRDAVRALDAPGRVQRIQMILSDPGDEPLAVRDRQSAFGAYGRQESAPGERSHDAPREENGR